MNMKLPKFFLKTPIHHNLHMLCSNAGHFLFSKVDIIRRKHYLFTLFIYKTFTKKFQAPQNWLRNCYILKKKLNYSIINIWNNAYIKLNCKSDNKFVQTSHISCSSSRPCNVDTINIFRWQEPFILPKHFTRFN